MLAYQAGDEVVAEPFPGVGGVPKAVMRKPATRGWPGPMASLGATGLFAAVPEAPREPRVPMWIDPVTGAATASTLPPAEYEQVRVSPVDSAVIAFVRRDGIQSWTAAVVNLKQGSTRVLVTTPVMWPRLIWAPDGKSLVICNEKDNGDFVNLHRMDLATGSMRRLTEQPLYGQMPLAWSPSSPELIFVEGSRPDSRGDLKTYSFATGEVTTLLASRGWDVDAAFSPDGKWLAYASGLDGQMSIFLRELATGKVTRIAEGRAPVFSSAAAKLIFSRRGKLFEVEIRGGSPVGSPRQVGETGGDLFDVWTRQFDLAPDGRVLSVVKAEPRPREERIEIVRDIAREYKRLR